jgi:hypothetical protein
MICAVHDPTIPLQIERLRRKMSRLGTMITIGFGSLALFPILLIVPYTAAAAPLSLALSLSMTLYSALLLRSALRCPACHTATRLDRYWVCGFCTFEHTTRHLLSRHTFVETCARQVCGKPPHSLICFGCRKPIIWDDAGFKNAPEKSAWLPHSPPVPMPVPPEKPLARPRPIEIHRR